MTDVTQILNAIEHGDSSAADQLLPLVYEELRVLARQRLANEKPGQTLQATALVHDAYLRLVDVKKIQNWKSRGHFFGAAAEAMRRILVERARAKRSIKHGGELQRIELDEMQMEGSVFQADLFEVNEALTRLEKADPQAGDVVKLKYFAGLTIPEIATALGVSTSTVDRQWAFARAWLHTELRDTSRDHRSSQR